jgi:integrase
MAQHLTDAIVKRLEPPAAGNRITKDDAVKGFGCRVTVNGNRSFTLDYTTREGRQRRITIGDAGNWTTVAARNRARELRREIDQGGDPLGDIEEARAAPTVDQLLDRVEQEHLPRLRPRTRDSYHELLANHVRPHFGKHAKVSAVRGDDIDALHRRISKEGKRGLPAPYQANRTIAVLSKCFALAIRWGMRDDNDNPCKGTTKNKEYQRRRYLKPEELARLVEAMAAHPNQQAVNAIRLLLLTGARRGEILSMRWADLDLGAGLWSKPPSSTKQKEHHEVPLSAPARQLLAGIHDAFIAKRQQLPEYVFPGGGEYGHVMEIKRTWHAICKAAGITNLRVHDLRHSYASELVSGGATLPLIGALLGHSNPNTTNRYAHLYVDPLRAATERVGATIVNAGKPTEEPVKLPQRGR